MSFSKNTKSLLSFLLRVVLSVALLWYVFSKIDIRNTIEILKSADLIYIFIAAVIFLIINGILLYRWFIFIEALDLSVTVKSVVKHYFYGLFGNLFLPTAVGGDLIKVIGLCRDSSQKPKVVASVIIDRLSGFASIAIVAAVAFLFGHKLVGDNSLFIMIIFMVTGILTVAAVLLNERIYSFGCRVFNRLPRFKEGLMTMHYDIALLKQAHKYKAGIKGIAISCVSQVIFATTYYFTAKALHQDIAIIYFLIFVPIICVAAAFPSIGGLGVREFGAVYLFSKIGVESGIAVSLSLINFLFMVMVGLVGGVIYVYTLSARRIQCYSSNAAGVESG